MFTLNVSRAARRALPLCLALAIATAARAGTSADASAALQRALSGDNIAAAAKMTSDPEVLIGYALLVSPDPLRDELAARAAESSAGHRKYATAAAMMWTFGPASVDALLEADPSNAYPHYLKAGLLMKEGKTADALAEAQKGHACASFDSYTGELSRYALKALDTLNLDRNTKLLGVALAATNRVFPYRVSGINEFSQKLGGSRADMTAQEALSASDCLMAMGNKMLSSVDNKRTLVLYVAQTALKYAYLLKAAASPDDAASSAVATALNDLRWSGGPGGKALSKVGFALSMLSQSGLPTVDSFYQGGRDIGEAARDPLKKVIAEANETADRFLDIVVSKYYDAIVTQAVEGELAAQKAFAELPADEPVLQAAESLSGLYDRVREIAKAVGSPQYEAQRRLKELGLGLIMYSNDHEAAFPPDLQSLVKEGYIKNVAGITSPFTGKPFIYVAGKRDDDPPSHIIAYEETPAGENNLHTALYVDGHTMGLTSDGLAEALAAQAK